MFVSFHRWTLIIRKRWKEKLFLPNQIVNIVYPNKVNMIVVPITKSTEIVMKIQVWLISRLNFDYKENGKNKSFTYKSKASISCIPIWGAWSQCPITRKIEIFIRIQVWLMSRMNFDYRKNGGKKSFSYK